MGVQGDILSFEWIILYCDFDVIHNLDGSGLDLAEDLEDTYSERDLEAADTAGAGALFARAGHGLLLHSSPKRMTIGDRDFYLDLLFYHRSLRRLVAIELKLGSFDAAYKGQMELYLRWLDRYERRIGEEPPIGLILCGEKNREQIELLQLDRGEIRVAEYLVELPPREMLEAKLHEAIRLARGQVEEKRKALKEAAASCPAMSATGWPAGARATGRGSPPGSAGKMDAEAARRKAREMKAEALGS